MTQKILGLDISRNFAVGFLLESFIPNPKDYFESFPPKSFYRKKKHYSYSREAIFLSNDLDGLKLFNEIAPDVIILEPTGYYYSQFWVMAAKKIGCEIKWVSHQALAKHRSHYGFKNKNDDVDAFVLALTYFDQCLPKNRYMVNYDSALAAQLRLTFFERKRIIKSKTININQLRQFLCIEHPEIAERDLTHLGKNGVNPTLGHLAGVFPNRKFPKQNSGLGITPRTLYLVKDTVNLHDRLLDQERLLKDLLVNEELRPYVRVFERYGFSFAVQVSLLVKIYPLERFLDGEGKISRDSKNRNLSLRHFQSYLGLAFTYLKSGDGSHQSNQVKRKWEGSKLLRADLYMWVLDCICPEKVKPKSTVHRKLKETYRSERTHEVTRRKNGKKEKRTETLPSFQSLGKDGICRFLFLLTRWLWRDLVEEVLKKN